MSRNLELSLQCEHSLRALTLFVLYDFMDLIVLIIIFTSVSLITQLPPFSLVLFSLLLSVISFLWVYVFLLLLTSLFVFVLYRVISLLNLLRCKSSRHQIQAVTSATESVPTNSCTIIVSGHFIPLRLFGSRIFI